MVKMTYSITIVWLLKRYWPHVGYWYEGNSKLVFPETPIIARDNKRL